MINLTDSEKKILERLEAATPGPWKHDINDGVTFVQSLGEECILIEAGYGFAEQNDYEFIAHAPTDIRQLLETVAQLRSENANYKSSVYARCVRCNFVLATDGQCFSCKLTRHKAAAQKLVEALKLADKRFQHYADNLGSADLDVMHEINMAIETYKREVGNE